MLELNLVLMLTVFVFFFTLLFLLNKILFQPMLFFMENRDKNLNSNSQDIDNINKNIELINLEASNLLKQNNIETNLLIENIVAKAKKDILDNIQNKKEELNVKYKTLIKDFINENLILRENLKLSMNSFKEEIHNKFNSLES